MFDWLGDIFSGMGDAFAQAFSSMGESLSTSIFDAMTQWIYKLIFDAIADFFQMIGNMGAEIFDLAWVKALVKLFSLFGWSLFVAGMIVAIFDMAIEYQKGRSNPQDLALNVFKGFMACALLETVPIELYKFCVSLQNTFSHDLSTLFASGQEFSLSEKGLAILHSDFAGVNPMATGIFFRLLCLIAFGYCVVVIFFQNIKRGGILLVQISVGSLYMFSVPRGYSDGFIQWIKQLIALCLTAFMQTTLLYLGLMTFQDSMLLGLGIMLSASEVPRIAQQFGLDSNPRFSMMSVIHTTSSVFNMTRILAKR